MSTLITFPKSYLYAQYDDDASLQAMVDAFNQYAQAYLDHLINLNLPIYTGGPIVGPLLDWVGQGIYGISRPYLPQQPAQAISTGAYNSWPYNQIVYNGFEKVTPTVYLPVTDDIYKRTITWSIFKGDGKFFTVRWLKRRVMRFLFGVNGINPPVDQTYPVSIIFAPDNEITIRILNSGIRTLTGGTLYNRFGYNTSAYDTYTSTFLALPPVANADILQQAIQANILPLPFQYQFTVQIG